MTLICVYRLSTLTNNVGTRFPKETNGGWGRCRINGDEIELASSPNPTKKYTRIKRQQQAAGSMDYACMFIIVKRVVALLSGLPSTTDVNFVIQSIFVSCSLRYC